MLEPLASSTENKFHQLGGLVTKESEPGKEKQKHNLRCVNIIRTRKYSPRSQELPVCSSSACPWSLPRWPSSAVPWSHQQAALLSTLPAEQQQQFSRKPTQRLIVSSETIIQVESGTSDSEAGSVMSLSSLQIRFHSSRDSCSTCLSPPFSRSCTAATKRIAYKEPESNSTKRWQEQMKKMDKPHLRWDSRYQVALELQWSTLGDITKNINLVMNSAQSERSRI